MEIGKILSPIAQSALLTKRVRDHFVSIGQQHLADAIVSVFVKNSYIKVRVIHTLARTEIRMYGEPISEIVAQALGSSESYSVRISV
jgi:hypothetical protein